MKVRNTSLCCRHTLFSSDVVLVADALPRVCLEAENFDASVSCQLARYFVGLPQPQKNCLGLALASTSLPRSCLGVRLPWLVLIAAALVATVTLTPSWLLIFIFTFSDLSSRFTNSLEHLLCCLASPSKLTASALPCLASQLPGLTLPRPWKNALTTSLLSNDCSFQCSWCFSCRSFFQSVCVLGYCVLPLTIALIICQLVLIAEQSTLFFTIRCAIVLVAFGWSTFGKFSWICPVWPA